MSTTSSVGCVAINIDLQLHDYAREDNINAFRSQFEQPSTILEQVTPCGNSFLHIAASHGSEEITKYLARQFPGLITKQNLQGDTALHLAARYGRPSTAKILVEFNSDLVTVTNRKGNTALHDAVIGGDEGVVKCLVSKHRGGSYHNNNAGQSPLYLAVELGSSVQFSSEILDHLLGDDGSSVQTGNQDRVKSPVHSAVEQRNKEWLKKIAAKKPELMWLKDEEERNPLHYASSTGYVEGVVFLIEKLGLAGATEKDQEGNRPIHVACKNGFLEVVKKFLEIWPHPTEFLNEKEQNILHVAAENGQEDVVRYILRDENLSQVVLNETDEDGNTPLHLAAERGRSNIVFVLVSDKRVRREVLNNKNSTPYDIAENQSQKAVDEYESSDTDLLGQDLKEAMDILKKAIIGDKDKRTDVDPKKQDKKASSNHCEADRLVQDLKEAMDILKKAIVGCKDKRKKQDKKASSNYFNAVCMSTFSILYLFGLFTNCRKKKEKRLPLFAGPTDFASPGKPTRKEETKSRIENLLVIAVLVAGATFAGAIQLPQLSGNDSLNNRFADAIATGHDTTSANSSPTDSYLLDAYLYLDVLALNISVVAALILLWTHLNEIKFAPLAVWFSSLLVGGSIYLMCWAFFFAVRIAIGGSNCGVSATIIMVLGGLAFPAQTVLCLAWFLPPPINEILAGQLSHIYYFMAFFVFYALWKWVPDQLKSIMKRVNRLCS